MDIDLISVTTWKLADGQLLAGFTKVYPTPETAEFTLAPARAEQAAVARKVAERNRAATAVRRLGPSPAGTGQSTRCARGVVDGQVRLGRRCRRLRVVRQRPGGHLGVRGRDVDLLTLAGRCQERRGEHRGSAGVRPRPGTPMGQRGGLHRRPRRMRGDAAVDDHGDGRQGPHRGVRPGGGPDRVLHPPRPARLQGRHGRRGRPAPAGHEVRRGQPPGRLPLARGHQALGRGPPVVGTPDHPRDRHDALVGAADVGPDEPLGGR